MFCDYDSEMFKAWVAAWLDGEGCIKIPRVWDAKKKKQYHKVQVAFYQLDARPLLEIQKQYGGVLTPTKDTGVYQLTISTRMALRLIRDVLPYLIVKKDRADLVVEFYKTIDNKAKIYGRTPRDIETKREEIRQKIMAQNQNQHLLVH